MYIFLDNLKILKKFKIFKKLILSVKITITHLLSKNLNTLLNGIKFYILQIINIFNKEVFIKIFLNEKANYLSYKFL